MAVEDMRVFDVDEMELPLRGAPQDPKLGCTGEMLKHGRRSDMVRLAALSLYGIVMVSFITWTFKGEVLSRYERVLRTGNIPVDQIYSALALSTLFTPLAILLRNTATRLSRLHPFMVASSKGIQIADLDRMSEGGIKGAITICRYAPDKGLIQIFFLIAGAVVVPCATLIITTGIYVTTGPGTAVVALPLYNPSHSPLGNTLNDSMKGYNIERSSQFATEVADLYKGMLLSAAGVIPVCTPDVLSNTPTPNLPLTNDTFYNGILTYHWNAGCQPAPEIRWNWTVNRTTDTYSVDFSSPDRTKLFSVSFIYNPAYVVWMDSLVFSPSSPLISQSQQIVVPNATTYYAFAGITGQLYNYSGDGVDPNSVWVSTVKCKATMAYEASRCQWNGVRMVNCTEIPGANTTQLDTDALGQLSDYLNSMPVALAMQQDYILGLDALATSLTYTAEPVGSGHRYRVPTVMDFTNMYGLVASSIVLDVTNGFYGTANVTTDETFSYLIYSIRTTWLLLESLIVFICLFLLLYDILSSRLKESPIREISFIAVATATRGNWWDKQLEGLCAAPKEEMRRNTHKVTFGVDSVNVQHIGLGPKTTAIVWDELYRGASIS